ncbi:hypothetical protein PUN28_015926 [Cardiocondyla obscurior]|uniref:Uncharacterized protein n=1 Tax=Cardiocondyla obscurior TaxID=286306 RepID=A0AAW2EQ61_9HYME
MRLACHRIVPSLPRDSITRCRTIRTTSSYFVARGTILRKLREYADTHLAQAVEIRPPGGASSDDVCAESAEQRRAACAGAKPRDLTTARGLPRRVAASSSNPAVGTTVAFPRASTVSNLRGDP